jgi:hypothetical protein
MHAPLQRRHFTPSQQPVTEQTHHPAIGLSLAAALQPFLQCIFVTVYIVN